MNYFYKLFLMGLKRKIACKKIFVVQTFWAMHRVMVAGFRLCNF